MKRFFLTLCTLLITTTLWAAAETINGVTWNYRVIDGQAEIQKGSNKSAIPSSTTGAITIPSTLGGYPVTSIGNYAVAGCSSLTSVTIPEGVTSIGDRAFSRCTGLTSITIPEGVTSIGDEAFYYCSSLTSVTIPSSVTSIGNFAFFGCTSLTSIHISDIGAWCSIDFANFNSNPLYYASKLYLNGEQITNLVIPNSISSIGNFAFAGCSSLTSVTIPEGVTSIGYEAFYKCSNLPSVIIPKGVVSIGDYAFYYCTSLTSVTIPEGVISIGDWAFGYCSNLTSVTIPEGVTSIGYCAFRYCSSLTSVTILEGVISIGEYLFHNCSSLTSITIPSSVTSIEEHAFLGCSSLNSFVVDSKNQHFSSVNGLLYSKDGKTLVACPNGLMSVTIPKGVTSIGNSAFYGCSNLTSVTISEGVTLIGDYTFYSCKGLTSVTIPEGVTSIGDYAFYGCTGLTSITIPEGVTLIGDYTFYNCSSLTSVTIPAGVTSIGGAAFRSCSSLTSVTIPLSVTSIGDDAFDRCSSLASVHISDIGAWCSIDFANFESNPLYYASKLYLNGEQITNLVIPNSVPSIGNYAFYGCSSLTSVTIPEGVTSIGDAAFRSCSSLTSVTIPEGVTSIGGQAFFGCSNLTSVTIPEGVTSIGNSAFYGCSSLTSVTIPEGVTLIGDYTFFECESLTSVTIPEGVTSIGDCAFYGCTGLTSITIPESVTFIDARAFVDCVNLWKDVNGIQYESEAMSILIKAPTSISSKIVIPKSVRLICSGAFSGCTSLNSVVIPSSVTSIGRQAFYNCSRLTSVTIPEGVTSIGDYTFYDCSRLTSVTIPEGVTSIGEWAFQRCLGLTSITIPSSLTSIERGAFGYCSALTSVTIPEGVTSIGTEAFRDCSALTSVTIPEGVTSVGSFTFYYCTSLTSVTIPEGVTSIGDSAFYKCERLTSVTIPEGVTTIWDSAFSHCLNLTSVTIPEGVTSIGNYVFSGCTSLTSVTIPSSVTSIGEGAFYGCTGLTSVTIPEGVTSIGRDTFYGCTSLSSIMIPSTVTSIDDSAFEGCTGVNLLFFKGEPLQNLERLIVDLPSFVKIFYSPKCLSNWKKNIAGISEDLRSKFFVAELEGAMFHEEEISTMVSWDAKNIHWILGDVVVKANGGVLTIAPGAIVKFLPGTRLIVEEGATVVANGVTFTHLYDRSVGENLGEFPETYQPQYYDYQIEGELVTNEETQIKYYDFEQIFYLGTLRRDTIFEKGMVYLISNKLIIPSGVTLTIEPGAIVKFMPKASLAVSGGGVCLAQGAIFTHVNDDTIGGDTLKDGGATHPVMGEYTISGSITDDETTEYRYLVAQELTSNITHDTRLCGHRIYVVSRSITVSNGATLTIQPGAILKFESDCTLMINGVLKAEGTRAQPIIMTSIKDDSVGGDTNGDGNKTMPQPGDWVKIGVNGGTANFDFTHILYSSKKSTTGAINMNGGTVTFSNGEIAYGMYDAVGVESGHFYMTNSIIRDHLLAFRHWPKDPIVNCVIYDCGRLTQGGGQTFINCIFSNIAETWEAFGFPNSTYKNCVFWNERGSVLTAEGKQDALTVCGHNGNIWGDPLFVDPMNGDFRIVEGSPCVDAADSTVAPEVDYYGQPRITMTEQPEGEEPAGQLADIGICEVMPRDITSDIDLVPLSVRTASETKPGELLFVKWEVQNVGGAEVSTAWRDTILLVSESGRTVTLGEKVAGNQIAAGGTVFCSGYFVVPAIEEGSWYVKVNVNSYRDIFEGSLIQNNALTGDRPITLSLDALDANTTNRGVVDANSSKVLKFTYDEGDTNRMMTVKVPAGVKVTWGFGFVPQGVANSGSMIADPNGATFRVPEDATDVYVVIESDTTAEYEVSTESTQMVVTSVYPTTLPSSGTTTLTITGAGFDKASSIVLSTGGTDYALESFVQNAMGDLVATVDCATLQAGAVYTLTVFDENDAASLTNAISVTKAEGKGELVANLILPESARQGRISVGYIEYTNVGTADMDAPIFKVMGWREGGRKTDIETALSTTIDGEFTGEILLVGISATHPAGLLKIGETNRIPFYYNVNSAFSLRLAAIDAQSTSTRDSIYPTWQSFSKAISDAATELNRFGECFDYNEIYRVAMRAGVGNVVTTLRGQVYSTISESPCANVTLQVFESNAVLLKNITTNEDGYFEIKNLKVDETYTIVAKGKYQFSTNWCAKTASLGSEIFWVDPLGEFTCSVKGIAADNVNIVAVEVKTGQRVEADFENNLFNIKDLRDGEYTIGAEINGYYCLTDNYNVTVDDGVASISNVELEFVPSGVVVGTVLNEKGVPVPAVQCFVEREDDGKRYEFYSDENGQFIINVPAGVYIVRTESSYSLIKEYKITVVNQQISQNEFIVTPCPFMLKPAMGIAPFECSLKWKKEFNNYPEAMSFEWDFDSDGVVDSIEESPKWTYTNAGMYDVTCNVTFVDGTQVFFAKKDAVDVLAEEIEILADDTVKLDKWSGWDIIDASDEYITVKFNEHCIASYLDVGTKIILPANPLSPYKILSLEKVEDDMLLLQVEPIFVELAYDTLAKTYSVELMADDNGLYNGGYTDSIKVSSEISKSFLNDTLTITGEVSLEGTATVLIYEKKLEKCSLNVEAKASLTGTLKVGTNLNDVKKKKNKKKKKKKDEDEDLRYPIATKVIVAGYVPIVLNLYAFADGEISMSGSVTTAVTASVEVGYSKVKGWFFDPEGDASFADLSINGNASLFFGLGVDFTVGIPSTKLTKSLKLSALDGSLKAGPNFYVDIKYHPFEDEVADEYKIGADLKCELTSNLLNIKLWKILDWKALTYRRERAWPIIMYTWKTPIPSFSCEEINRWQNISLSTVEFKRTTTVDPLETLFKSGYWEIDGRKYVVSPWSNQTVNHDFYIPSEDSADSVEYDVALYESYEPGNSLFGKLVLPAFKAARTTLTFGKGNGSGGGADWRGLGGHGGTVPQSFDPNEMAGPLGIGDPETERFVKPGDWMTYTVYFENKSDATAAAQEVRVTNPLSQYLDWSTFEMGEVAFNNQVDLGLSGKQTGASEVALNNTAYKVKTTVALDQTKGEVNWYLRIVDPSTETTWPEDVYAGILPPNDETHRGEGHLTYRVKVREDVPAGVRIDNSATIIFDYNEPIETDPAWWNRVVPSQVPMSISPEATLVNEGETIEVKVFGGDLTRPSSAQVYLSYHTAAAADLDLAKATVTGVYQTAPSRTKLAFPLTLNWATGEVGEQTIRIPVKTDKAVEDEETFTLQLANPENMALGSKQVCMVTLHDTNAKELKAAVTPYKPKPGESPVSHQVTVGRNDGAAGFVAGSGEYTAGSKLTLTAEARPGYAFVGWALKEDLENLLSTNPKYQIVVGEDGDYVAVFEPIPYVRGLATPAEGGKVTGSGYCADGKKVTLKASANKNFVFKGWYAASVENPQTPDEAVCVATTPSLVIDRTAKPTANSKTSTTLTDIDEDVTFFALFEGDPRLGLTMMPESAGKVTGAGRYLPGTKVTLKATPNKGYVFAGWYQDEAFTMPCESILADYRNPSYTYVTGAADATLHACFVPAEEDQVLILTVQNKVNDEIAETFTINGKAEFALLVDSKSLPKVSVKGLPAGMKFTATPVMEKGSKTEVEYPINTIYGTPTKPGLYTVTVSLTNSTIKKAITKTFEINVLNFTDDLIKVKDSYGPYVPGVSYTVEIPEAAGCTVTGLPAGMKWTAKDIYKKGSKTEVETPANSVYGIPTTPGNYTVYFTKTVDKVKHTATATFKVGPYPQLNVMVSDGGVGGKVAGIGAYAANKKVTLKATPNKGYVFAGWYKDALFKTPCDSTLVDYRTPNYTYVMGEEDTQFYARFVTKEDEADYKMGIALYPLDTQTLENDKLVYKAGEAILPIWVMVDSLTLPKVTVKGLPKGMKFDAKTFTISGMPTQPGDYVVYVEAVNASKSCVAVAEFYFTITHYDAHGLHQDKEKVLMAAAFEADEIVLDENFNDLLNSVSVKSFKLPSGLSYDPKTNSIKGNGTLKCGTYVATLTDTEGKVTTFTIMAELANEDKFTYRNALSLDPDDAYGYEGIVQGANAEVVWLEVLKSCDLGVGGTDVLLDPEEAKAISIKVSGLPTGLKANFEKEYVEEWEGDEYVRDAYFECVLWLEGKTSAAPGDYHVTVTITNSRTGQVEDVPSLIRIYPPQPIQMSWNASFSTEMVDEETGEVRNAHADVVYSIDGTSGSVTYSLTIDPSVDNSTEKPITRSGKFSLWCIGVRETLDGETYYSYEFDHITMTTELYAWIDINASHEIQDLHFDYWEERLSDVYDWVLWEWDDSPW